MSPEVPMPLEEAIALVRELGGAAEHVARMRRILMELRPPTLAADADRTFLLIGADDAPPAPEPPVEARYADLGLLGRGGMGEVRRIRDRELGRTLAMKIASPSLMSRPTALARFAREAQTTAQLQHPGIVPVHELGTLPDGRRYFTMQEVRGRTLTQVIAETHSGEPGWTLRRLISAYHRICETVVYAHTRGVIHRDLKPDNVMVGDHGQVLVLDWGIAKLIGRPDATARPGDVPAERAVVTDSHRATRMGAVAGTPAYMPPEQARGEIDRIDARCDVYALGAILYEVLSGRAPYVGSGARDVLERVRAGPPRPVGLAADSALPAELVEACGRAMARDPAERFPNAAALTQAIQDWLDGAKRRERALSVAEAAQEHGPRAAALRAEAAALRSESLALLDGIQPWEPEERKAAGWTREDTAMARERRATLHDLEVERGLHAALRVDPELPEAHAALAERFLDAHRSAESARDEEIVLRAETGLRAHTRALPPGHSTRTRCDAYLQGDGALTLVTDPHGAAVSLHRYVLHSRRMVPRFERELGHTPLRLVSLPMGSYLCVIRHPDRLPTRVPVFIGRGVHQDGVPPGRSATHPIRLLHPGEIGPGDCYVPPGWFWSGGDPQSESELPRRRVWLDGLVVQRFPITNADYVGFLNDLPTDEALRRAPREKGGSAGGAGALIFGRDDASGRFTLRTDSEGDVWEPDVPVVMIDWWSARAYAEWFAARTGFSWRLPLELEWEKAARGVDGRFYPWGDTIDPSWCCMRWSHRGRPLPARVDSFPVDESVFGVRGMAGNTQDWCADLQPPDDGYRVRRGGSWVNVERFARCVFRRTLTPSDRFGNLGFRLVRSVVGRD